MNKKIYILCLILVLSVQFALACEMMVVKGLNNGNLVYSNTSQNTQIEGVFEYFKKLGANSQETHGFGTVFYYGNKLIPEDGQIIVRNSQNNPPYDIVDHPYKSATYNGYNTQNANLYTVENSRVKIIDKWFNYNQIRMVHAHKRFASSGSNNDYLPNPHPWVYSRNSRVYSFSHNGTANATTDTMIVEYNTYPNYHDSQLDAYISTGIDSGILFAFLMLHIKMNDMDVLAGIHEALKIIPNGQHNFILTDGADIYAYKSNTYALRVYHNPTRNIAMVTSMNTNFTNASQHIAGLFGNANTSTTDLAPGTLAYIPAHGMPYFFSNINFGYPVDFTQLTLKRFARYGTNWHSFPVLPSGNNHPTIPTLLGTYPSATSVNFQGGSSVNFLEYPLNIQDVPTFISESTGFIVTLPDSPGYVELSGELKELSSYFQDFQPGQTYWVTYNLTSTQSIREALGPFYSKISKVEAEGWTYKTFPRYENYNSNAKLPLYLASVCYNISLYNADRPMEFAKTYKITLKNNVEPIQSFTWSNSRMPAPGRIIHEPVFFKYDTQSIYEVIEIVDTGSVPDDSQEIGVFYKEKCIGASKVDEFPLQILVYSGGYAGNQLTIRALYPKGNISELETEIYTYDEKSEDFYQNQLIAGNIGYSIALFGDGKGIKNSSPDQTPAVIITHNVYPNPFNPSTTINFSISSDSEVVADIYNAKGQKVDTLFSGHLPKGNHFLRWNGTDQANRTVASGLYFYRITTDHSNVTGKMLLMK